MKATHKEVGYLKLSKKAFVNQLSLKIEMSFDVDLIDLFTDTAAILNSIVLNIYFGMFSGQISMYLPPEHPIIAI